MNKSTLIRSLIQLRYLNQWIVFFADLFLSTVSTLFILLFVSYMTQSPAPFSKIVLFLSVSCFASALSFFILRTYKGIIRHSTLSESVRLASSVVLKNLFMFLILPLVVDNLPCHHCLAFCALDSFVTFSFLVLLRALMIVGYHLIINNVVAHRDKLLIYIGGKNRASLEGTLFSKLGSYNVDGYLRYGHNSFMRLGGYSAYGVRSFKEFSRLVEQRQIKYILFTNHRDVEMEQERLIRHCEKLKLRMLMLPSADELKDGKATYKRLPELRIEDLLGRDEIQINMDEVYSEFTGKNVLVTGAAGSIGSELCRQLAQMKVRQLILFDSAETPLHNLRLELEKSYPDLTFFPIIGDVRIKERVRMLFEEYRPEVVFHAAAYKHVPLMEENPCEAVLVNVVGSRQVADMALAYGAEKMIMISTDKAVNPTNVMGASKRLAEIYVQSLGTAVCEGKVKGSTQFITTRFGNVLGSNGSVIPRFKEQIKNGGPVTVTHPDIIRFFMTIPEACRLVMEAATMGCGNEIFVFEMGKPVKIVDLATRMIELAGYAPGDDIRIEFSGLRPGEKLYEEVLSNEENTIPTDHKKIMIAKVRHYEYTEILKDFERFEVLSRGVEVMDTVKLMKQMVPEFISKNSERFEVLDRVKVEMEQN
ncbi:MAG: polysaccharide biosynthesis protein [Bacteroidia bacterium]|nr:polysaccharide biosynthesis protein [Bacteroidia bacterium]